MKKIILFMLATSFTFAMAFAEENDEEENEDEEPKPFINSDLVEGLKWRSIGPAWASGRIADFAVNPKNSKEYYVGVASGGVWKTKNNGTTWEPIFDKYGSYAIGIVELDPNDSNVLWVGTGENNHQRVLGYGDGVYKSVDGGKSFENMGLKESRQIGGIVIDPRNSDIVFVASEGSAWGPGEERGLYKTADGGESWTNVLKISEDTGVNNVVMDPSNPEIMYVTSEQRRRTSFTKIGGGPDSSVYKSTDGGENWRKITKGLPDVHIGGMGIDVSPVNPNYVYLIIEAAEDKGGFYRSTDKGESWNRMSDYSASGQYYNEIVCDPKDVDKVYSTETFSKVTIDGGETWKPLENKGRHVDDHAIWIDPSDTEHLLIGGDGGIYETWDAGATYDFKENLPLTQFYRVHVDNDTPFYTVYGGTQDNNSMGGPSRTTSRSGVVNDEWLVLQGGDGFWVASEPGNPDIVYVESQYGNVSRYDKKSGERVRIKPREGKGELTYKWNWNTPMFVSPHQGTRLYLAANKVFKSEDRGNTWEVISGDLTAQVDRNSVPVMGKYWPAEAVVKDVSTSLLGTLVSLDESKIAEGLLYAGSDDGVISVTDDGGANWAQVKIFEGVPEYTYVSAVYADRFDEGVVYATFDNTKRDDFTPYVYKSTDQGETWASISGNLPGTGVVHTLTQDFIRPELLFVGTEFGIFFTVDAGENWVQLKSGLPTIPIRDIAIQERESDLAVATFGRGFYILDDYSPLREVSTELEEQEAAIFPIKDALMFVQTRGRGNQGSTYFTSPNPDYGATFTYFIKDVPKTKKALRKEEEKERFKEGEPIPQPSWRELQLEGYEEKSHLIFTIYDAENKVINQFSKEPSEGISRVNWGMTYSAPYRVHIESKYDPISEAGKGIMVMPGRYKVGLKLWHEGELTELVAPVEFTCKKLNNTTLPADNYQENIAFYKKVNKLALAVVGTEKMIAETRTKVEQIKQAIYATPGASQTMMDQARALAVELEELDFVLNGSPPKASDEEVPPAQVPLKTRLGTITSRSSTSGITATEKQSYEILKEEFPSVLEALKRMVEKEIPALEAELNKINAPWTSGRFPVWKE